jgi:ATP-dependent protease HslVU (ClpYQ) peptidase subunit
MTTIATDGRSMAGDGLITDDNVVCATDFPKVRRLSDGRIVGFCGNSFNYDAFADWLESGEGEPPAATDGFGCIVLATDGTVTSYDERGRTFRERGAWAIGSGCRFAIAAMDMGKSPAEAVAYAVTRDIFTGGEITVLTIEPQIKAAA